MEDTIAQPDKTEIIAMASGKGGTGKTLIASCLGYALIRAGQRVLMIDGDPATDGLSLFLLGPKGTKQISTFEPKNTFTGILGEFQNTGSLTFESRTIHRTGPEDHGIPYEAIISGRGLYGDDPGSTTKAAVPDLDQSLFRAGLKTLFEALRKSSKYDYILVDTRGGFAFESTDVCALADSFIVVTEPDITSFYQDRNLVRRISQAAQEVSSPAVLRAILVNKATDGVQQQGRMDLTKIETSFRLELTKEFPIHYEDTHPIPVDIEALLAYKTQNIPYNAAPGSLFSFATLSAFSDILQVVTSRWPSERVEQWNRLVNDVSTAVAERSKRTREQEQEALDREKELAQLRLVAVTQGERLESLQRERDRMEKAFERELERSKDLYPSPKRSTSKGEPYREENEQYGLQPDRQRRWVSRYYAAVIAVALLGIFGGVAIPAWRVNHSNDLLTKAYDKNLPPALRSQDINELVNSYHHQQFDSINLDGLDLSSGRLENVSFRSSSLVSANLSGADLKGATFVSANLAGADLSHAILSNANFGNANLTGTNLSSADLTGSRVTREQIRLAIVDENTRLPVEILIDKSSPPPNVAPSGFVSIQFNATGNPGLKDVMEKLNIILKNEGWPGPDIEEIDNIEYTNTVRYFNKEDQALAEKVKTSVEDFMHSQAGAKYKDFSIRTHYLKYIKPIPRGQIEIWCNPKNKVGATTSATQAAPSCTPPTVSTADSLANATVLRLAGGPHLCAEKAHRLLTSAE
jgi:cellulose biosynthesis protein BcsQ